MSRILDIEDVGVEPPHLPAELSDLCRIETVSQPIRLLVAAELAHPFATEEIVDDLGELLEQVRQLPSIQGKKRDTTHAQGHGLPLELLSQRRRLKALLGA